MVYTIHSRLGGNDNAWVIPASVTIAIYLAPRPAFLDSGLRRNDDRRREWQWCFYPRIHAEGCGNKYVYHLA